MGHTIASAAAALRDGSLTAVDLVDDLLARTSMIEAQVHAYLTLDSDGLRASAAEADRMLSEGTDLGPLHGIPVALKDNMTTRGIETTAGSKILSGYVPPYDGTVVARLKAAGARGIVEYPLNKLIE